MSKLIEKLRQISEGTSQPMGFRTGATSLSQSMLLIAASTQADRLAEVATAEVDSMLARVQGLERKSQVLQQIVNAAGNTPWGIWAETVTPESIRQLVEAGGDFLIFEPATTPALLLQENELGKVLKIDPTWDNNLIGAVERLPVDVVLIDLTSEGGKLTVSHLMRCQRLTGLTNKPLLVAVREELSDSELQALRETGATGVIAEIAQRQPSEKLLKLRQAIKALPANTRGRREGKLPILPRTEPDASPTTPDET
jgi:hypothetical protein